MARKGIKLLRSLRETTQKQVDILIQSDEPSVALTRNFPDGDHIQNKFFVLAIPQDYCLVSDAVQKLEKSMFGNLNRQDVVVKIKAKEKKLSVGHALRMEAAKKAIRHAAVKGKLLVYRLKPNIIAIQPIERRLISSLILVRGGLPDYVGHLVRANNRSSSKNPREDLRDCILLLRRDEFEVWIAAERSKKKWQSQGFDESTAPRIGRPKKSRELWTQLIVGLVDQKKWKRSLGVPALRRKLIKESDDHSVPSEDTLARIIVELCKTTKNPNICLRSKHLALKNRAKSPQK